MTIRKQDWSHLSKTLSNDLKSTSKDGVVHPYVSAKLLRNGVLFSKQKTSVFKNTTNPVFSESLEFDLTSDNYPACTLVLDVKDDAQSSWIRQTMVIGQLLFDLAKLPVGETLSSRFELNVPCYSFEPDLSE
uniref:C2 domain-containing protein n=1 Tax=Romanomermis culicivorax TaxID=13658 RepID=A0A915HJC2_ROMCU